MSTIVAAARSPRASSIRRCRRAHRVLWHGALVVIIIVVIVSGDDDDDDDDDDDVDRSIVNGDVIFECRERRRAFVPIVDAVS